MNEATTLHQQGRLADAERLYRRVLGGEPRNFIALHRLAILALQRGLFEDALHQVDAALGVEPRSAAAIMNKGTILMSLKRFSDAIEAYDQAITIASDDPDAHFNRGIALAALQRTQDALAGFERAIELRPTAEAYSNRGNILIELQRLEDAVASYDQAIALEPRSDIYFNRGSALKKLNRLDEAIASCRQALTLDQRNVAAHVGLGNMLGDLKQFQEALASFTHALSIDPGDALALNNRGAALLELHRIDEALESINAALAIKPDYAEALNNRANCLFALDRREEGVATYDRAIAVDPDYADAHFNRGNALLQMKRPEDAQASFERTHALNPDHRLVFNSRLDAALQACNWAKMRPLLDELPSRVADRRGVVDPFVTLLCSDDPALHLTAGRNYIHEEVPPKLVQLQRGRKPRHKKIRIAYVSADFHSHATAWLMTEMFELHDRDRFEVFGISLGMDDRSDMRERLTRAFDHFEDSRSKSDWEIAQHLSDAQIDIAVDLKGYSLQSRPVIFAYRPAPIQVNFLGYPATMGADFIDYIIADHFVAPHEHQAYFTEKIVHLPDSYQVNDSVRSVSPLTPTRRACGLPEHGMVFCCFNNNFKITPEIFDVWMRVLRLVPDSVLWLLGDNAGAERNLRREAEARGIEARRLVFAERVAPDRHLARHRLADLFLDTLPYNAHTTASDALWMGLPVLTCQGRGFAGRVASSLLNAFGLPDLVVQTLDDYQAAAVRLATSKDLLASYKRRLEQYRFTCPLFDTGRFTRHIEAAYCLMRERYDEGLEPIGFSIRTNPQGGS